MESMWNDYEARYVAHDSSWRCACACVLRHFANDRVRVIGLRCVHQLSEDQEVAGGSSGGIGSSDRGHGRRGNC